MKYRSYEKADGEKCLAIFRGNTPGFFGVEEEPDFADFLERLPCPFFVLEIEGVLIGCGGYFVHKEKRTAGLCWGMVACQHHKRGYGKFLLLKRLDAICNDPFTDRILMDTSQHSKGFFERLGFSVYQVVENGYTDGLHRHEMELKLDKDKRLMIHNLLADSQDKLQ